MLSHPRPRPVPGFAARGVRLFVHGLLWCTPLLAQQTAFSVQDVLDVANVSVADVSEDGRWAVMTMSNLRDRIGIDNYRYGDPTYVAPGVTEIALVDVRTGERRLLFPDKAQVRGVSF